MKRSCRSFVAVVGMLSIGGSAMAQAPGQAAAVAPAAVTSEFLEKRVPDELATEGVVLSRQGLSLKVEQVGPRWLVSLVDLNTSRVAASTKLDSLSPDREAAVATMTHIVAELAVQVTGRAPAPAPPPAPASTGDLTALAARETAAREARELSELSFRRHAIRFGSDFVVASTGSAVRVAKLWEIYQGELDQPMTAESFYKAVNRPDLYRRYQERKQLGVTMIVGGIAATVVGLGLTLYGLEGCGDQVCGFSALTDVGLVLTFGGSLVGILGTHVYARPHPIDEGEAKALADRYNQGLRKDLGLPVVSQREPVLKDVRLAPFAGVSGGGLALGGRF